MLELEDIKSKISDIEKRIEEANYNERELESAKADFRNNRKEFEARFAAVRLGNSTNPFEIRKKDEEEAKLKDREEKLDEEEKEIKDEKLGLKQEFDEFVSELAGNIKKEKDRINAEAQNPEISLNMLNDEKQKLISDKEMYLKRIAEWEENNINPNDVLYKRLKEELVPKVDTRIAEIDKELEELEPEKLSEMYNELEKYENVVKNLHTWDYKIKEMCQVFDVKTQEQIRQEEAERQRQEAEAERQRQEARRKNAFRQPGDLSGTGPTGPTPATGPSRAGSANLNTGSADLDDGIDIDSERKSMEEALGSKSYKITIGKEGKVKVSGKFRSIKVDQEVYKNAAELNIYYNSLSTESFMKEIENRYDNPTISKLIRVCKENAVPIDFTVIDSINNVVDGGQKESDALIKGYIFNVLGAHYDYLDGEGKTEETKKLEKYKGIPFIDNIYLTYNLNSLSSIPLKAIGLLKENDNFGYMGKKKDTKQSWVEKTVLTSSQRDRIANLASIANQYEIADEKGTYHETILAKAIRFFNSSMKKFLPTKETIKLLNSGNIERIDESIDRKEERRRKLNENGLGHVEVEPIEVENSSTDDRTVISSEKEYDD